MTGHLTTLGASRPRVQRPPLPRRRTGVPRPLLRPPLHPRRRRPLSMFPQVFAQFVFFSFLLFAQFEFAFAFFFIHLFPSVPPFVAGPAPTVASGRSICAPLSAVYSRQRPLRRAAASPWLALKIWTSFCGCTAMCVFLTLRRHRRTTEGRFISPAAATLCANRAYATVRKLHHL